MLHWAKKKNFGRLGIFGGLVIAFDQLIKFILVKFYPGTFSLNQSFSGRLELKINFIFWIFLLLILIILIIIKNPQNIWANSLLVGGSLGNLVDRIFRKGVIDYWNLLSISFNFADLALVLGIFFYFIQILTKNEKAEREINKI